MEESTAKSRGNQKIATSQRAPMLAVWQRMAGVAQWMLAQARRAVRLHPIGRLGRTRVLIAMLALLAVGPVQLGQLWPAGSLPATPGAVTGPGLPGLPAAISGVTDGAGAGRAEASESDELSGAPVAGWSQYMVSTDPTKLRHAGCRVGQEARTHWGSGSDVLTVLDFGRPARHHYIFGTVLFGTGGYRSTTAIAHGVEGYLGGYIACLRTTRSHLELAIGTSNFGPQVTPGHGAAWAGMVNQVSDWTRAQGYGNRVGIDGASDIELAWSSPGRARRWVNAYGGAARHPYFDFGDADSCPPFGNCYGGWRQEDVWYVAFGARGAIPLPEIYAPNGANAKEWQQLSLYSVRRHGRPMIFAGAMSQREACRQSADPCRGMNNTPQRAWEILAHALRSDGRTAQRPRWSTDVRWSH